MQTESGVAIFWDFETAKIDGKGSGCQVARDLSNIADQFGVVKSFRMYLDVMNQLDDNFPTIRRELYSSGVTMVDCPSHSGRDIADKVIIVDMLSFIMDQPPPYTIVVVTGDNDLCFTLATLRRRRYKVALVCPLQRECEHLVVQADETRRVEWIGTASGNAGSSSPSPLPSPSPSSVLSYADSDTRRGVQNTIISGRKVSFTAERPKKLTSIHIPNVKPTGGGLDIKSRLSNDGMISSPVGSPHDVQDTEKPRDQTGTSSGPFFPPVPSFPLEVQSTASTPAKKVQKPVAEQKSPSPQTTEEFSVVDDPRDNPPNLDNHPNLNSHNSLVPTPISEAHQVLTATKAATHFPATSLNEFREVPLRSVAVPAAIIQRTGNPIASTNDAPNTSVPSTALLTALPVVTSSGTAAPIATTVNGSAPVLTSTVSTEATAGTTASQPVPEKYRSLVRLLQFCHRGGEPRVTGSKIAATLVKGNVHFYASVGVKKWGQYISQAAIDGIVVAEKNDRIYLREQWMNVSV